MTEEVREPASPRVHRLGDRASQPTAPARAPAYPRTRRFASSVAAVAYKEGRAMRHDQRPFIHHQQSASTTGSITVEGLLRIASTAHRRVNA